MRPYQFIFIILSLWLLPSCRTEKTKTAAPKEVDSYKPDYQSEQYLAWDKAQSKRTVFSFEQEDDLFHFETKNSQITASTNHAHLGKQSLLWTWQNGAQIKAKRLRALNLKESKFVGQGSALSPTFIASFYSPKVQDNSLRFSFIGPEGQEAHFDLQLNFSGWRTVWVPFYDMSGGPKKQRQAFEIESCIISAQGEQSGQIYVDDIIFSQFADDRHQYPSLQTPFVKASQHQNHDHWMPHLGLLEKMKEIKKVEASSQEIADLTRVQKNLEEIFSATNSRSYESFISSLHDFGLTFNNGSVQGPPLKLTVQMNVMHYELAKMSDLAYVNFDDFWKYQLELIKAWKRAEADEKFALGELFLAGLRYTRDQGYQMGSSQGTLHHLGYQIRNYVLACFLARDLVREAVLLEEVYADLSWFLNVGEIFSDEDDFRANIDYLNTMAIYRLMTVSMCPDQDRACQGLKAFSYHLGKTLSYTDERGVFKIDGTAWHHWGHYPAYGIGAFASVGNLFQVLKGTSYKVWGPGHANFRRALLASRIYSQKFDWGIGISGRHPLDGNIKSLKSSFLNLALAGSPDGSESLDREVASAYMRLWGLPKDTNIAQVFIDKAIEAEDLNGNWAFPYADYMVHRRLGWMASVKGYSKNVWSSEIYTKDNRYGRYQSNGSVQIMKQGNKADGYLEAGWDWSRVPGATVIEYPAELLEPKRDSTLMFTSSTTYAGSLNFANHGVFAMYLNSLGLEGRLKARKSVFALGDRLICLGSDIKSREENYGTSTVLFQHAKLQEMRPVLSTESTMSSEIRNSVFEVEKGDSLRDGQGNSYVFLENAKVNLRRALQRSPNNKYSIRRGDMHSKRKGQQAFGEGLFDSAVIKHGKAPSSGSYAYEIWPGGEVNLAPIKIIQRDHKAHVVYEQTLNTLALAVFEKTKFEGSILKEVSQACLMSLQKVDSGIILSVADPDVNDAKNESGKRLFGHSLGSEIRLSLKGEWKLKEADENLSISYDNDCSSIIIKVNSGLTQSFILTK
ncbi:chondroitinase family polysaccharide lyase [Lentisphaera marina]|uniref:chondroitinase family polysaccharide lyase n=1 Tax=Lentisphaera marina TaxID=1111041 RepID=UPI0023669591|nr:chondroitinase family polysaccharide lyase [Lentisphaera marina]MDD7987457.1 chondroitinase family polysaccharide lyase [Lentisphaera marina]